ncbi:hypothetical protein niasHT_038359 [Heterodera trifolii]|uniref:Uncharacterized protein n=1 Tax=Heterodera trifolii TaxID=157864 RepID=A0ABD2I7M7_9BILA
MAPLLRVVNVSGTPGLDMPEQQQEGNGELQYFVGSKFQRGGGLLQNISRFLMPVATNLLKSASKEGISAGTRMLDDLAQGKAFKESLKTQAKQGFENLAEKLNQCGKGPYLFRLFSDSQFCDLSKTYMYLLSSIERKNDAGEWVALSDTDPNDKHVNISGIEVFDSSIYYHYRDYIMKELGYSQEIRKAFHEASCYYADDDDQNSATNSGFTARAARFFRRQTIALMLNNQDVIFTIHRNNDSFLLLTPPYKKPDGTQQENKKEYRIRVHDMRLYVRTVDVTPSLNLAISRQLESTSAKYPLRKIEMRSIFLGTGRTELAHNVFTSTLPRRLICTFVSTDAYSGSRRNGQTFPSTPYLLSFDGVQPRFVRAFVDMYAGLGLDDSDTKTVSIGMQRFLNGWAFFVIPLTSTLEDTPGFELIRQGTCTIKVQFDQPIKADGYEMLVLGEFDSVLSINADRVLSTDGTQLEIILKRLHPTKNKFIGVFPSDRIPKRVSKFPHCMVVNTDKEGTRGEHWVACYALSHRRVEYFDSLGEHPNPYLAAYLNTFKERNVSVDSEWAVSLQNVYTLHSYQSVFFRNEIIGENVTIGLFEYNGHSFTFFEDNESGETTIFRGHQHKIVQRLSKHGRIVFDHLSGRLFLIDKYQRRISEIELEYLEHWWLRKNQSSAHTILKSNFVAFLPPDKSDFTMVDNHVFVIRDQRIYKFYIGDYAKGNRALTFVTNSNDDAWIPISYLFNLFLIVLCTYILKQLRRVNRKNPLNGSDSADYYSSPFIDDAYSSQHQQLLNIPYETATASDQSGGARSRSI